MPEPNTKGISVHVDAELHAEIRAYLEAQEMTMSEFVALAARDELHPRAPDLDPELQAEVMAYLEDSDITVDEFIALDIQNKLHPLIPGIDDALEAEIQAYLEENEMDIGDFIAYAAQNELHPKTHEPEVNSMGKEPTRTLAFQVPESLFERVKEYLERNKMTQKAFVIGLIEDELDRDEDLARKQQENARTAEEESQDDGLSEDGEAPVSEDRLPLRPVRSLLATGKHSPRTRKLTKMTGYLQDPNCAKQNRTFSKRSAIIFSHKEVDRMAIKQIQDSINYMEKHILEDIGYVDVAKSVHMSGYSFHRAFRFTVGITANEYLRCRRLSLAGQDLQTSAISVLDAAYKYGYQSPESFSKAFTRFHGSTPKQAKSKGTTLRLFDPLVIKISIGGGNLIQYRIEHRESQKFVAVKRGFSNETSLDQDGRSIPEFWEECGNNGLISPMQALRTPGKADLYGLCAPLKDSETEFYYGIGVRVDQDTDQEGLGRLLADGYTLWETGAADYAVFPCVGPNGDCLGEAWDKFFKEFSPQTGYTQTDDTDYEIYFETSRPGLFCELWVPVVKD